MTSYLLWTSQRPVLVSQVRRRGGLVLAPSRQSASSGHSGRRRRPVSRPWFAAGTLAKTSIGMASSHRYRHCRPRLWNGLEASLRMCGLTETRGWTGSPKSKASLTTQAAAVSNQCPDAEHGQLASDIVESRGWECVTPGYRRLMLRALMTHEAKPMRLIQEVANRRWLPLQPTASRPLAHFSQLSGDVAQ